MESEPAASPKEAVSTEGPRQFKEEPYRWVNVVVFCFNQFQAALFLTMLGTLTNKMAQTYQLTPALANAPHTAYSLGAMCMTLPTGVLAHRFGLKKTYLFSCILQVFGTGSALLVEKGFFFLVFTGFTSGVLLSSSFLTVSTLAMRWFKS